MPRSVCVHLKYLWALMTIQNFTVVIPSLCTRSLVIRTTQMSISQDPLGELQTLGLKCFNHQKCGYRKRSEDPELRTTYLGFLRLIT
uniref:Secreted protein n=1 Tax=Steinernema glaseri TaxID=37863 RepID=A0A1I7ZG68_9BILA